MRARWLVQVVTLAFMGWLYGGDLLRLARLSSAPVAAMVVAPNVVLASVGLAVALLGAVALFATKARVLFAVMATLVLLFDFGVLSSGRPPRAVDELVAAAVAAMTDQAQELATTKGVADDRAQLGRAIEAIGAAPFFIKGEPVPTWSVEVQHGCAGPVLEVGTRLPGTLIYCVAPDERKAWVTAVTLDDTFGPATVRATDGFIGVVNAPVADESESSDMWDDDAPAAR